MAIYHFSGTVISRSQGRSAVVCAAYRAGEKLYDERYGKEHDYTKKLDVLHKEILLPSSAPAEFLDRGTLWNAVEAFEKRKDAQLSREFNFALPRELMLEKNILLAREFVQETFVSRGMIADLCIHSDKGSDGEAHPHAHVMLTMREVSEEGFGPKVRAWNDKALLLSWRETWAEFANKHLALNGHDLVIDHRSFAEQGIDLEPQHKIGSTAARDRLARLADHQRIARENGEKLLSDPSIALHAITQQQSTFTHQDLARFVNRHTVDQEQFLLVYEKVKTCEGLVALGVDDRGVTRYTTQEMLSLESGMIERAEGLSRSNNHPVHPSLQASALSEKALSEEQRHAFEHLVGKGDLSCVVGLAGTGKSYLLGTARDAWERAGYRVHGVTLSGIAAETLEGSSGIASRTFASRCYYWDKGEQALTPQDVLVVDEAGMLSSRQMARLLDVAHTGGAKVVLVGDPQQLQAIGAGAAFRATAGHVSYVELTGIRRQALAWQRESTKDFALGYTAAALKRYEEHSNVHVLETQAVAKTALVELWNDARLANPSQTQIMLAYTKVDVLELNQLARGLRQENGELGSDVIFKTERGERAFAKRDRVYFLKNDRALGVMNGTLGTIESIKPGEMTIRLDQGIDSSSTPHPCIHINIDRYHHLDHGYAATIHKAQGITVDRSYVLASKYLDQQSTYVAMTRHRHSVDLFYGKDLFLTNDELVRSLSRDRAKDVTLDYLHNQDIKPLSELLEKEIHKESNVSLSSQADPKLTRKEKLRIRQERLHEITESAEKLIALSKDGRCSSMEDPVADANNSGKFRKFRHKFSTKHPEPVKELVQQIVPEVEREATQLAAERQTRNNIPRVMHYGRMVIDCEKLERDIKTKIDAYEAAERKSEKASEQKIKSPVKQKEKDFDIDL